MKTSPILAFVFTIIFMPVDSQRSSPIFRNFRYSAPKFVKPMTNNTGVGSISDIFTDEAEKNDDLQEDSFFNGTRYVLNTGANFNLSSLSEEAKASFGISNYSLKMGGNLSDLEKIELIKNQNPRLFNLSLLAFEDN